mmetsp:Transcript_17269/g.52211  ORF Transcript_17269/g.52211 Transcript_17269/m.52211 type:complete len:82 (-) Transcript_17269:75-320(-)
MMRSGWQVLGLGDTREVWYSVWEAVRQLVVHKQVRDVFTVSKGAVPVILHCVIAAAAQVLGDVGPAIAEVFVQLNELTLLV